MVAGALAGCLPGGGGRGGLGGGRGAACLGGLLLLLGPVADGDAGDVEQGPHRPRGVGGGRGGLLAPLPLRLNSQRLPGVTHNEEGGWGGE